MNAFCQPWIDLSFDAARLTCESTRVIALRMVMAARGDVAAQAETALMFSEKAQAALDTQQVMAEGLLKGEGHLVPARVLALYRDRVRANHVRLTQPA